MRIYDVKICGLKEPVGYAFGEITVSWKVSDTAAKRQKNAKILIARDPDMQQIAASVEGNLSCTGQAIALKLNPRSTYYAQVFVEAENGESAAGDPTFFETGKMEEPWIGKWITTAGGDDFHPVFERRFTGTKAVKKARLYICGLGLYEAYLNGKKVGKNYLAPFFNDYRDALQAQTYDVTEMLSEGNCLSILLGNGWYKGRLGYEGKSAVYGDRFSCIAELHIEYEDGAEEVIATDKSWTYWQSDIISSDIYDGEEIDRRIRCKIPYQTGKSDAAPEIYRHAAELASRANVSHQAVEMPQAPGTLTDSYSMPLKAMEELPVREIIHTPAGETVLDFGQNFAGFVSFHAAFPAGTRVVLSHGEILQNECFYHDNYRTARTQIIYTSDGREEWVRPHFTYMGFRYVKVEGWPYEVKKEDFKGIVLYSAMQRIGVLETGNPKVNRLIENALWGMKSNFLDMPTDCPQRDERLGWTGDAQVFAPAASFFMDTKAFYRKYLWELRNDQKRFGGAVANYLPNINDQPGGSSVWGDAATFIPDTLYREFGDKALLKEQYPLMKDWLEWIRRGDAARPGGSKNLFDFAFTFGDWLALDGISPQSFKGGTEDAYVSSVYYYATVKKTAEAAQVLGYEEDAREYETLAQKIRQAILDEYFAPSGRLAIDTQTGYIIALYFGFFRDKEVLCRDFQRRLKRDGYRIKCGFVGAPLLCETLAENGMENLAFHMLLQEEFPGWLHCVNLGATTIWERWNSVLDDGSISGTGMNSLNHYAYGSVIHYIKNCVAGLVPLAPGYKKVRIAPQPDVRLGSVKCSYDSASGRYEADWKINPDGTLSVHFEIPFDCDAEVILPGSGEPLHLTAGVKELTYQPGRDYRKLYEWDTRLEELAKDERAMEILKAELPKAYEMAESGDIENLGTSLAEMKFMSFLGLLPEAVDRAAKKIFCLEAAME